MYLTVKKGSLTVETALVLPIFLFAVLQLISLMQVYLDYTRKTCSMHQEARLLADTAIVTGSNREVIDLFEFHTYKTNISLQELSFFCINRSRIRIWSGYDNCSGNTQEKYVYITENKDVYHTSLSCSHLKLSIHEVSKSQIKNMRNEYGEMYSECDVCKAKYEGISEKYYITDFGSHFHHSLECPGITRTIIMVSPYEVSHLPQCQRCAGGE